MATKTTYICSIFCYILLQDFWFLHDLELIILCLMFFDQNDLYLIFNFKMVIANTQMKAVFIHVNYNIINNIYLKGLAQPKIIKKSVILFWLLNMTMTINMSID